MSVRAQATALFVLAALARLARAAPLLRNALGAPGLTGGQVAMIASVGILGAVCLVASGVAGCVLCARMVHTDHAARRQWEAQQSLVVSAMPSMQSDRRPRTTETAVPGIMRMHKHADTQLDGTDRQEDALQTPRAPPPPSPSPDTAYCAPLEVLRIKNMLASAGS